MTPRYEADYLPDGGSDADAERSDPVSPPPAADPTPVSAPPATAAEADAPADATAEDDATDDDTLTSDAPVSAAPVSASPVSASPVSATPVSASPVSAAPVSASPVSAEPYSAPAAAAPTYAEPMYLAPTYDLPTYEAPAAGGPTVPVGPPMVDLTKVEYDEPVSVPPAAGTADPSEPPAAAPPPGGTPPGGYPPGPPGTPPGGNGPYGPPPGGPPPSGPPPGGNPPGGNPPGGNPFGGNPFGGTPFGTGFNRGNLVRPQQGRYVAGVCAAIGRATNTDPTLWRVIFAVLTLAGGVSIVAYLLGWLLLPAEGDTGSPLEALLGRGRSATSAPLAIVIGVGAVLAFLLVMSRNVGAAAVGLAVVIGVVALLVRGQGNLQAAPQGDQPGGDRQGPPLGPFVPPPGPAPATPFPPSVPPFQTSAPGYPTGAATAGGAPSVHPAWQQQQTAVTQPVYAPRPTPPAMPPPIPPLPPLPPLAPVGYRPPFAPHGPFGGRSPYAASLGYPPGGPGGPYPGLAPTPPKPPKPPKVRSRLGRVIFSLICLSLGVLAALEVTTANFLVSTYFAVPLAIVALGLIVGAWFGRARLMILLGVLLSIALAISTASRSVDGDQPRNIENINISPLSVDELDSDYRTDIGDINADLSGVDFTGEDVDVSFRVDLTGNMRIILPPNVDVTVEVRVEGGDCRVLDRQCGGFNQTNRFTDTGADGAGGGKLHLDLKLRWGNLEVTR